MIHIQQSTMGWIYRWHTAQQLIYNHIISAGFWYICYLFKIRLYVNLFIIDWGKYDRFLTGESVTWCIEDKKITQQSSKRMDNIPMCAYHIQILYIYVYDLCICIYINMHIYIHTLVTCMYYIHKYMCVYMYNLSEYMVECLMQIRILYILLWNCNTMYECRHVQ